MARFLLIFCGVLGSLFAIEMLNPVQQAVIQPFTVLLANISTAVIVPFDDTVIAQGRILRDATTGFAVSIEAGCNGVEAAIVLVAGIVAFPASVQHKVIAILAGFVFVQALNIARIISLFYLGQWNYTESMAFTARLPQALLVQPMAPLTGCSPYSVVSR